ncbi:uncharacterized protein LOC122069363 [Macadamia integrifolia]|uniref:uncharacterized protein LOC122069363 n=1 Tax=Macadamia integrifolia TaxID=60698 RepID=UPI001C4F523C|nr:uncharacterized protein LOC122069363 [Macadamia integrifolia]
MDLWSWICELPSSDEWVESNSPLVFKLAIEEDAKHNTQKLILFQAERTSGSNTEALVTFSISLEGFYYPSQNPNKTLWVSDPCPLSADKPFLPLLLQLLQEIIARAPIAYDTTCPRSQLQKLKPEPVSWILDSHSPESFSTFFNLVFLCRLFWLCVCDAPAEAGSLYMESLLGPNLSALSTCKHVLRTFLTSIGVDGELCFMHTLGYMLAKWLILRGEAVAVNSQSPYKNNLRLGFSYATESHGLWSLKGYAPVLSMTRIGGSDHDQYPVLKGKDFVLTYALAHQQLEAVIQLEYTVEFHEGFIQVTARVDNLRFHVSKLSFSTNDNSNGNYDEERHFPSRIRVWVGPEIGATYVAGLSLGRSTDNPEREVKTQKVVKGNFGKSKSSSLPRLKATAITSTRKTMKNWKWEQDAEGNAAVFEAVLCDNTSGDEVVTWKPRGVGGDPKTKNGIFRKRYSGASRTFNKSGSVVFARDEYGEEVGWRLSKDMEGSVLKWRIGGKVWLSYFPCDVQSSHFETRCVDWCDEVDLPLIPPGN